MVVLGFEQVRVTDSNQCTIILLEMVMLLNTIKSHRISKIRVSHSHLQQNSKKYVFDEIVIECNLAQHNNGDFTIISRCDVMVYKALVFGL